MNLISIYLLGVVVCATVGLSHVNSYFTDSGKRIRRLPRHVNSKCGIDFIFDYFGVRSEIDRQKLSRLMKRINIGSDDASFSSTDCSKCISPDGVLKLNGYQSSSRLNRSDFEKICPSLIQQLVSNSCKGKSSQDSGEKVNSAKAWGFGILSVTIISLASMLGAFVVPFMNKDFYKKILLFMVSLAVGVLGGSGLFHLLPHTFGLGSDEDHSYLWKCSTVVGGVYFFFITENIMKIYIRFSEWKRRRLSKREIDGSLNMCEIPGLSHTVSSGDIVNTVHNSHALDSVHVNDKNCQHEHGVDSLNMAGDHCVNEKNTSVYFKKESSSVKAESIFERVAPVAWMIIIGDGLHNFIDGLAIGVSFTSNIVEGISTSLAILCEELPHELGDFAILLNSGLSYKQALIANFLSACTCYVGMIIGTVLGSTTQIVKWIYAIAAGMFLYISLVDMLPEATGLQVTISATSKRDTIKNFITVNVAMILGFSLMLILAVYSGNIQV